MQQLECSVKSCTTIILKSYFGTRVKTFSSILQKCASASSFSCYTDCRCPNPPVTAFGTAQPPFGPYTCGTFVRYTCNPGYQITGQNGITCVNTGISGQWNGPAPQCQVIGEYFNPEKMTFQSAGK